MENSASHSVPFPSHVAMLVPSAVRAAAFLQGLGFKAEEPSEWEGEGTLEIYVGLGQANSLLLMEPIKPGAYQRAMEKRGPGLHHLAVDVCDLDIFLRGLNSSGWLLHPESIRTIARLRTAYLARPGFPGLIEVQEKKDAIPRHLFVDEITLPVSKAHQRLLFSVGLADIVKPGENSSLAIGGTLIPFSQLF